ncbi:glycosyltransferase family 9 protein [Sphingobacterium sp. SGG-5]|uniref:glycosyltransferase family 9 protein n=1 Tax=Sphingobacterium sp. SGG-5 TaxID=2710881 RepID=UPI0013EB80F1|nr:glycosyltransferase family 9 protein [Sphingobacterium sp. SGG-5]NGM61698.1 glycosyltransferase family 9 protein [Sphingobacterium sp. SGG-5]
MKIAVFRALQLGDLLCAMPAIRALKRNFPHARIYLIGLFHMEPLISRFSFIDGLIPFPGYPGLPEQAAELEEVEVFIAKMCEMRFDILFQMHGNGTIVNDLLQRCEARRLVGFCPQELSAGQDWLVYPDGIHEIYRHLKLLSYLGLEVSPEDAVLEFPLDEADRLRFQIWKNGLIRKRYAIIHVGSRSSERQWPIEKFAVLAQHLKNKGLQLVLTGTLDEMDRVRQLEAILGDHALNVAGQTDLGQLGCLVDEAEILVSNCTGISHIAAALATKSIIISLDGEPERWGPLNTDLHYTYNGRNRIDLVDVLSDMEHLLLQTHQAI